MLLVIDIMLRTVFWFIQEHTWVYLEIVIVDPHNIIHQEIVKLFVVCVGHNDVIKH